MHREINRENRRVLWAYLFPLQVREKLWCSYQPHVFCSIWEESAWHYFESWTYCEPVIEESALLEQECTVIPERKATWHRGLIIWWNSYNQTQRWIWRVLSQSWKLQARENGKPSRRLVHEQGFDFHKSRSCFYSTLQPNWRMWVSYEQSTKCMGWDSHPLLEDMPFMQQTTV